MVSPASWLDRYRAGQRDRVWHELRELGAAVREPGLSEQAQLVCDEMAWRARHNVEVIIRRLSDAGYRFHANDDAQDPVRPHVPPAAGAGAHAKWLQERFENEHQVWREQAARDPAAGLFVLPLAPDRVFKDNVSGGPPYGVILPDASADGLFAAEPTMPFVSYLNWVFRSGGFPWPTAPDNHRRIRQALARDLLPL